MSIDTKGIINKKIEAEEIYNFIVNKIDKNAKFIPERYNSSIPVQHVVFQDSTGDRTLTIICDSDKGKSEYSKLNFTDDENNYVWLSLGKYGDSIQIMKTIVNQFGGYVDEDDCDDEDYYYIPANPDKAIPDVIRVTMQDIYKKFGGVVIITDK